MTNIGRYESGLLTAMRLGTVSVPGILMRTYARMGLSEIEAMLLIHLMYFMNQEGVAFPTPEQLSERMSTSPDKVLGAIERLVREGMISIEDSVDEQTLVRSERYDLSPLYRNMAAVWANTGDSDVSDVFRQAQAEAAPALPQTSRAPSVRETAASRRRDLFTVFESEFARPLSPLEYETIVGWLDQDQYSDSLIMAALKEAVFAGKVHFRYIDRILMEWKKNRITTPEEAKAYTERFRGDR